MFHHLSIRLSDVWTTLHVFQYVTFRAAAALATAFLVALLFGRWVIPVLRARRVGENTAKKDSERLVELHRRKSGTPTMGGVILIVAVVAATVLWARLDNHLTLLALYALVACGLVGFLDDRVKLRRKKKGLSPREKFGLVAMVGAIVAGLHWIYSPDLGASPGTVHFPFLKGVAIPLGIFYLPFAGLVLVATANAVNLTDGLDGLAIGCTILIAAAFAALAYVVGRRDFADYLYMPFVAGAEEVAIFSAALAGAGLGFLWFNCHPAEVFMGDTGSLAIGGALGFTAVALRQEVLLVLLGGVFVAEAASVILQVSSYRLRGRRIFRCAPLHHHFEFSGLFESKITTRFWIVGTILAVCSLVSLKVR